MRCFWCNAEADEADPLPDQLHATWCPRHRRKPPPGLKVSVENGKRVYTIDIPEQGETM